MLGTIFQVATAVLGIAVGWEPDAQGNLQYIIQIEPEAVDTMLGGRAIEFDLPPEHQGVHRFRFQVGKGQLPRLGSPAPRPKETTVRQPDTAGPPTTGEEVGQKTPSMKPPPSESPTFEPPAPPDHRDVEDRSSAPPGSRPQILPLDSDTQPIKEQKAGFEQSDLGSNLALPAKSETTAANTLMAPLVIASCTAVGLLATCLYLGWIHVGTRRQYRTLLADYYAAVGSLPGCGGATASDSPSGD